MDIFLDDKTSLHLLRATARDSGVALAPAQVARPTPLGLTTAKLNRLGVDSLLAYLRVPEDRPLGILVPDARSRVRSRGFDCSIDGFPRGTAPFRQLVSADPEHPSPLVPDSGAVYVLSPQNVVLHMAKRIRRMELGKKMGHAEAVLMILKLCLELCGTYVHDPFDPLRGEVAYGVEPSLTTEDLTAFLASFGTEQGLALAREAASHCYDLSGSPQESFLGPALFFPSRFGGLQLGEFVANGPLMLSPSQRELIGGRTITPDFQLVGYDAVIEYKGAVHEEGDNPRIDHVRALDYQTLGKRDFSFVYDDVCQQEDFNESAARIVAAMAQRDGAKTVRRFERLCKDERFLERQRILFRVFRPWLR